MLLLPLEVGSWKMESGRRKVEDGKWKTEGGRWKAEDKLELEVGTLKAYSAKNFNFGLDVLGKRHMGLFSGNWKSQPNELLSAFCFPRLRSLTFQQLASNWGGGVPTREIADVQRLGVVVGHAWAHAGVSGPGSGRLYSWLYMCAAQHLIWTDLQELAPYSPVDQAYVRLMSTGVRIVVAPATMATLAVPCQMDNKTSVGMELFVACTDAVQTARLATRLALAQAQAPQLLLLRLLRRPAMLSLITGKTLGVSKLVAPTIVWRDQFLRSGVDESAGFSGRMQALLANIITKGILPITGAGNLHENGIDAWPANFASTANGASAALPELLVVGGVLTDSGTDGAGNGVRVYSYDTAKNLPHVYAPAYNVLVADGNLRGDHPPSGTRSTMGTSDSAALTAGLAAYYLKLAQAGVYDFAQTPIGLKNWIISQAWERNPGVPAIWSGVIPDDNACEWTPPALVKRGLGAIMAR
ncbi:hypothetical protein V502_02572 [Pseudogymnoascus sp. VKM F-4520 (FW-2644)]|nr:hypothetical protein V502_02572 [Pseudogymnoascus sp. VKM F-4520 (FW-2644)]